jgi:hypothetical protein
MAESNLIPQSERTKEEQREIARAGGKASGRSRRRKRQFRDELEMLLPLTDKGKDGQPIINPLTGRKQTVQQSITMQLLLKARKGDVKAAKLILDTLGELVIKEEHKHEIEGGMVIVTADEMEKSALKKMKDED